MKKKLGFYPGCSLEGTAKEYSESVVSLSEQFDIELKQIPDWNCCGATAAHNLNKTLSLVLPSRILAQAQKNEMKEIVVPCAACYNRLSVTQYELLKNDQLKATVEQAIDMPLNTSIRILNVIQFIQEYILPEIPEKLSHTFDKKVACYYGCLLVRPHNILKFDRPESPQFMDEIMQMLGAETIDWPFKTECCGAGLSVSRTELVGKLSGKIVREALDRKAEAIIVACPMCHANLDMRRPAIDQYLEMKTEIPVLYITQAIGMACGLNERQTGTRRHLVKVIGNYFTKTRIPVENNENNPITVEEII
ncbi:MAG: CoB--CoM heterodisulfide reductase iron-sulfur subunit B family protein [Dysgonamonadaceae bacterium]|jgi:heterodisulfide reductase subunit B|nr:CoB--CoM heterodisulfide reductase iron-sulfur subunit B family protein [Dysgonamonadaceae bacterium]